MNAVATARILQQATHPVQLAAKAKTTPTVQAVNN